MDGSRPAAAGGECRLRGAVTMTRRVRPLPIIVLENEYDGDASHSQFPVTAIVETAPQDHAQANESTTATPSATRIGLRYHVM